MNAGTGAKGMRGAPKREPQSWKWRARVPPPLWNPARHDFVWRRQSSHLVSPHDCVSTDRIFMWLSQVDKWSRVGTQLSLFACASKRA